jgi:exopolyphosphatase / guanosine-5'-triphosphate,3'-diphosphate pyrophosphatase
MTGNDVPANDDEEARVRSRSHFLFDVRRGAAPNIEQNWYEIGNEARWLSRSLSTKKPRLSGAFSHSGGGIRTRDLRVMSPTSYQTAPPRVATYVLAKMERLRAQATLPSPLEPLPLPSRAMRVAVVDIGTNSTRLLIAEVDPSTGALQELERRSQVTRLGEGVDGTGSLADTAIARVLATLADYRRAIDAHECAANLAVLTSAVRDASNGSSFAARVREEFGLDARVLSGDEEAQLTFLGAMSGREAPTEPTVVIDIGGGSTEFVVGRGHTAGFHVSLPAGVVRLSERHIHSDPPASEELQSLARDARTIFLEGISPQERAPVEQSIAVAGTATSAAAIDMRLDPYDPARVHGYTLLLATVELLLARLAEMTEAERRTLTGLHPDRAPTIVAGLVLLSEAMRAFELEQVEVSEHDILHGGALRLAGVG